MPGSRDDDRRGGSGARRGGRGRPDRARRDDDRRGGRRPDERGRRSDGTRGGDRDRAGTRSERPPPREGRPPIKGHRRTFDVESTPNERERERLARPAPAEDDRAPASPEEWVDEGPVRRAAGDAVRRGGAPKRPPRAQDKRARDNRGTDGRSADRNAKRRSERAAKRAETVLEIDRARLDRQLGPARAARTLGRLGEAADAFADDRFEDARRLLKPLVDTVPDEPAIRELYGLTLYRLGRWRAAATQLEAFAMRTGSVEQHPVLADCHRALGHHRRVAELWEDLGAASPDAATVAEGRIVYAGSLADQGNLPGAIAALEAGALSSKKPKDHHLRMRYALGDLYDRAGEHHAARRHFEAVASARPDFFDVAERLRQL